MLPTRAQRLVHGWLVYVVWPTMVHGTNPLPWSQTFSRRCRSKRDAQRLGRPLLLWTASTLLAGTDVSTVGESCILFYFFCLYRSWLRKPPPPGQLRLPCPLSRHTPPAEQSQDEHGHEHEYGDGPVPGRQHGARSRILVPHCRCIGSRPAGASRELCAKTDKASECHS